MSYEDYLLARCDGTIPPFQFAEGLSHGCELVELLLDSYKEELMEKLKEIVPEETCREITGDLTSLANSLSALHSSIILLKPGFFNSESKNITDIEFVRKLNDFLTDNLSYLSACSPAARIIK